MDRFPAAPTPPGPTADRSPPVSAQKRAPMYMYIYIYIYILFDNHTHNHNDNNHNDHHDDSHNKNKNHDMGVCPETSTLLGETNNVNTLVFTACVKAT